MELLHHFSHQHPLVFVEDRGNENDKVYCSGCGEMVSGPCFSCVECGFHLDKQCADAPSELNHPFHRNHSFNLLQRKPHNYEGECGCDFCYQICENFVYHCSCGLDLHIKCALFSYNIAEKRIAESEHISRIDPLISTENRPEKLKRAKCFACWKPLLDSPYFSPDECGFHLHVKCVDLPSEISHLFHQQHPLILQFDSQYLFCHICQKPQGKGLVYCCYPCEIAFHIPCVELPTKLNHPCHRTHSLILKPVEEPLPYCQICQNTQEDGHYYCSICKFSFHIDCVSTPSIIEDKTHPHPFVLFCRHVSFICDACGTPGNHVSYICSTCGIIVHKKCTSLPPIIKFTRHRHPISHNYFLEKRGFENRECRVCREEVNSEHGSYFCSKCNYIVHVNCALEDPDLYDVVDSIIGRDEAVELSFQRVTDTSIKHFRHDHNLTLISEDIVGDKQCDGCLLFISANSYYGCPQCDFFLHKACAELPMKKHVWYHHHQGLLRLTSSSCIFKCRVCFFETSGFAYVCDECNEHHCLRCALVSDITRCEGHEDDLQFYRKYEGLCNACGGTTSAAFRCKSCNFNVHFWCLSGVPVIARHKCDEHTLQLTYGDKNSYSISHFCDICEKERNPNHWFYHCAICDSSAHTRCVLGKYPFIKRGNICKIEDHHPHPLTFVQKVHDYPECHKCGKHCSDLALECNYIGCTYIVHWECIKPYRLRWRGETVKLLSKDEID